MYRWYYVYTRYTGQVHLGGQNVLCAPVCVISTCNGRHKRIHPQECQLLSVITIVNTFVPRARLGRVYNQSTEPDGSPLVLCTLQTRISYIPNILYTHTIRVLLHGWHCMCLDSTIEWKKKKNPKTIFTLGRPNSYSLRGFEALRRAQFFFFL